MFKHKIIFTNEQLNEMVALHNDGYLNRELAEKYGVSKSTIARQLRELNIPSRHPWLNEERKQMVIELYKKYQNETKVAKEINMSASTVKNILIENGIEMPSMSRLKRKYNIDDTYFDVINSHEKAYFLGLMYADGYVGADTNKMVISLQKEDIDILLKFKEALKTEQPLYYIDCSKEHINWKPQYRLCISNKRICEALVSHGCFQRKSLILKFPEDLDEEYYSSFILGYFDGDGWLSKNSKDKRMCIVGTLDFCTSVSNIFKDKLNINTTISYDHNRTESPTRVLRVAGGKQIKKLFDWLYSKSNTYLERKHQIFVNTYC